MTIRYGIPKPINVLLQNYGMKKLGGKQLCKKSLQRTYKLPERDVPIIGMITRLAEQKGLDLIIAKFHDFIKLDIQFVLLGSGDPRYHEIFQGFAKTFPEKVAVKLTFDEPSAHEIEAGADMFLMPSRYEPCGLNQLYSLKYGTVPIVRNTGGLLTRLSTFVRNRLIVEGLTDFCSKSMMQICFCNDSKGDRFV